MKLKLNRDLLLSNKPVEGELGTLHCFSYPYSGTYYDDYVEEDEKASISDQEETKKPSITLKRQ